MQETQQAIFNTDDVLAVDSAMLAKLKAHASQAPLGRFRLCLHHDTTDSVQEMLIAFRQDSYCRPHCHPHSSASVHVIEGQMDMLIFDDSGAVIQKHSLAPHSSGKPFCLWCKPGCWHMMIPITPFVIVHEAIAGPFVKTESNVFAPWSPCETDSEEVRAYLRQLNSETR